MNWVNDKRSRMRVGKVITTHTLYTTWLTNIWLHKTPEPISNYELLCLATQVAIQVVVWLQV